MSGHTPWSLIRNRRRKQEIEVYSMRIPLCALCDEPSTHRVVGSDDKTWNTYGFACAEHVNNQIWRVQKLFIQPSRER